jgi:GT2 family glycosyltransferase
MINTSIVLFNNPENEIENLINLISKSEHVLNIFLIDNSSKNILSKFRNYNKVKYFYNSENIGFGAAHNIAFEKSILQNIDYHLIINPDIEFETNIITSLIDFLDNQKDIGVLMPKVIYPNGEIQRLAKLIPSPLQYFARRFIPIKWLKKIINNRYELKDYDYSYILDVPFLSGCFLIFRVHVLKEIGGFDNKIFLYFEDNDICRKILNKGYRSVIFPFVSVVHDHTPKSFLYFKNLRIYFKSGIYYFNKWGWFFDKSREIYNNKTLSKINEYRKV